MLVCNFSTWEAEAGGLYEFKFSLGDRVRPCPRTDKQHHFSAGALIDSPYFRGKKLWQLAQTDKSSIKIYYLFSEETLTSPRKKTGEFPFGM